MFLKTQVTQYSVHVAEFLPVSRFARCSYWHLVKSSALCYRMIFCYLLNPSLQFQGIFSSINKKVSDAVEEQGGGGEGEGGSWDFESMRRVLE